MRPWSLVIAVVAGLAIVALVGSGADGRTFAQRALAGVTVRPGLPVRGVVVVTGPDQALNVILNEKIIPDDAAVALQDARGLFARAATQPPEQAKGTLNQAVSKIDDAMNAIKKAAEDTSNLAVTLRLEQTYTALAAIRAQLQSMADQL